MKLCLECAVLGLCAGVVTVYLVLIFGGDTLVSL